MAASATLKNRDQTEAGILKRLIRPGEPTFSAMIAKAVLALEFDAGDQQRMHELALKAQEGELTEEEEEEIAAYRRLGLFLTLLKSKARQSLKTTAPKPRRANGRRS